MPRSAAPEWRKRRSEPFDQFVRASIAKTNGTFDEVTGHYGKLVMHGLPDRESARQFKNGLHASALWLHRNAGTESSMSSTIIKNHDGSYSVEFVVVNKAHSYKYMIDKYGEDQTKWPYSTKKFHPNYDAPGRPID